MSRNRRNSAILRIAAPACLSLALAACAPLSSEDPTRKIETSGAPGQLKPDEALPIPATAPQTAGSSLGKVAAPLTWVAFIPKDPALPCVDKSVLRQTNEWSENANRLSLNGKDFSMYTADVGGLHISRNDHETVHTYCHEWVTSLPVMRYDYAVLSSSDACPANSYRIMRQFDDEDRYNYNSSDENILPNFAIRSYTRLYFCFVPGEAASGYSFPQMDFFSGANLSRDYMIFAENHDYETYGFIGTDDEDDSNRNSFTNINAQNDHFLRFQKIIRGVNGGGADGRGRNTELHFAAQGTAPKVSSNLK